MLVMFILSSLSDLRRAVRTSMWTKDLSVHQHTYDEETFDEETDMYSKKCSGCEQVVSYEKCKRVRRKLNVQCNDYAR